MQYLTGGFKNVSGVSSVGKKVGIKPAGYDLAILFCNQPCQAAAVYTRNIIQGAPLKVTKSHLRNHIAQAIVVNSGIANVATGKQGMECAERTTEIAAKELGIRAADVLVASTGLIGAQLPIEKLEAGLRGVRKELGSNNAFSRAILTTDTFTKEVCVQSHGCTVAACAKGSGMIAPNMATMLAFVATDAAISSENLKRVLKDCVNDSFNMTNVDMDTSTSDMVTIMATGKVKIQVSHFKEILQYVCSELAKMIARDGEGATKLIICQAKGAATRNDARRVAKAIIASNLVKTAIHGNDPNWGRLMMAIGNSGAFKLNEAGIKIWLNEIPIVIGGTAAPNLSMVTMQETLAANDTVSIVVDLSQGNYSAEAYGCDMSEEYVTINAEYTS